MARTGSTNADLIARARKGEDGRLVLVTDLQTTGRGRLGRTWVAPAGSALLMSVLIRPTGVPAARRTWTGAMLGMAIAGAIRRRTGLQATLKWPNDVHVRGRKIAGILAEMAGDAVVVGAGINVDMRAEDLPRADATSLLLEGASPGGRSRADLRDAVLVEFDRLLTRWQRADGDVQACGILDDYRAISATIGRPVAVGLPGGDRVLGTASDVAADGAIVIDTEAGPRRLSAGDVTHLRAQQPGRADQR